MPRKRKIKHMQYEAKSLEQAVDMVRSGTMSYRTASQQFGVPKTTIIDHVHGRYTPASKPGYHTAILLAMEQSIVDNVVDASSKGFPDSTSACPVVNQELHTSASVSAKQPSANWSRTVMHKKRVKKVEPDEEKHLKNSTKDCGNTNQPILASHPTADITYAANRWEVKRAIKALCERLVEIGEEYFLVTANISSGWVSHFGSVKGQDYIEEQSDIAWNFYRYCQDEESSIEDSVSGGVKGGDIDHSASNLIDPSLELNQEISELMDSDSSSDLKEDEGLEETNGDDEHPDISMLDKYSQTTETFALGLGQNQGDTTEQSKLKIPLLKEGLARTQIVSDNTKSTNRRKRTGVKKRMYVDTDYFGSDDNNDDDVDSDSTVDREEKMMEIGVKERNKIVSSDFSPKREQEERAVSGTSSLGSVEKIRLSGRKRRKQTLVRRHWVDGKEREAEEALDMTPPNG